MTETRDFDTVAATWDDEPRRVWLAGEVAGAIWSRVPLSREWDALDFGCGTGLLTLWLAPHLGSITGVDSSAKMLECLQAKLTGGAFPNVRALHCGQYGQEGLPGGPWHLVTSSMTLHHIPEPATLLAALTGLLHPGGWIALADLETEDGSFHEDPTGVFHHGFSREQISELLAGAGFCDITITTAETITKGEREYPVFLATARLA